jgi:predicted GNAT family acetyltransferase
VGAQLVRGLQEAAAEEGRIVSIHVELTNRAAALYERLGFVLAEDLGVYRRMEWTP